MLVLRNRNAHVFSVDHVFVTQKTRQLKFIDFLTVINGHLNYFNLVGIILRETMYRTNTWNVKNKLKTFKAQWFHEKHSFSF